jgi:secreted trypsin-like serine protease
MPLKLKVTDVVIHPSYVSINSHDIALVKLEKKVSFSDTVRPVRLPPQFESHSLSTLSVPGFGETKNSSQSILHLRFVRMREISNEECSFDWGWKMHDALLCAVGVENLDHTTCKGKVRLFLNNNKEVIRANFQGDSGSGLVEKGDDGESVVLGLVSFGNPGCLGKPKVFTRISSYLDFIREATGIDSENY